MGSSQKLGPFVGPQSIEYGTLKKRRDPNLENVTTQITLNPKLLTNGSFIQPSEGDPILNVVLGSFYKEPRTTKKENSPTGRLQNKPCKPPKPYKPL